MTANKIRVIALVLATAVSLGVLTIGCGGSKSLANLSAQDLFRLGKEKYDRRKYLSATEHFQTLVYTYPGEPVVDTAQYYLALSYFGSHDYVLAGTEFNRLLLNYPSSAYATHAQFMKAVSAFEGSPHHYGLDQTETTEAIRQLEDFIIDHPESELVPDANAYLLTARTRMAKKFYKAGLVYTRINASEAATIYYQKVIDDYTNTEYGPLAAYGLAEEQMKLKKYDEARVKFQNFKTVYPEHHLAPSAEKRAIEAAFRGAEAVFIKGDMNAARDRFLAFKKDFPNDGRTRKADTYLQKIGSLPADSLPQANAKP